MCKLSDDFSGFVDTCGTGKRNRVGALVLGNGRIEYRVYCLSHAVVYVYPGGCISRLLIISVLCV